MRRLLHDYQSAAAFQRTPLRGVVARYRGFLLVVQAHAAFAAELSLALPDGTTLETITATTDTGVWQGVGHTISEFPAIVERLRRRIADIHERIATIDRELVRLDVWDGQATYDTAVHELQTINAAFVAAEAETNDEHTSAAAPGEAATPPTGEPASEEVPLAELLLTLAQDERADDGWASTPTLIPPAPASLALMADIVERQAAQYLYLPETANQELPDAQGAPELVETVGSVP